MRNQSELYANQIINALVNHRASILVGSGFSRNAISINHSNNKGMPLWNDLIDEFYNRLDIHEDQKYLDPLAIAQSMNDMYDRPTLDDLIYDLMHEDDFIPSETHRNLLRLPWKTVYTTNYDTLLERAARQIVEPKYVSINNVDDLLKNNDHPRIIKLHGSFPSNGPYIITEEDFRKYPIDHAPFVNTVQQSLLENTFCLIGFSGTDPNFLKWIGWIHDNLGIDKSPLIYMITDKPKSQAETKSFYAKKIGLIVLDDFYFLKKYGNDLSKKYDNFIKYLLEEVKKKVIGKDVWIDDESLKFFQLDEEFDEEELYNKLYELHNTYLGWIFIPHTERKSVGDIILECSRYVKSDKPKEHGIEISYEYCWLHDISGIPYGKFYVERILKIIEDLSNEQRETYRDKIKYIQISLLKYYRLKGTEEDWKKLINQIDQNRINNELRNSLIYEQIWHAIDCFDFQTAFTMVKDIEIDNITPIWSLRKGFILALAGNAEKANNLIIKAYDQSMKLMLNNRFDHNYYYLSLINLMYSFSRMLTGFNGVISYNDLKKVYASYNDVQINSKDFSWSDEVGKYVESIKETYENLIENRTNPVEKHDFDHIYVQYHFSSSNLNDLRDEICSYFYFREATGIPFIFKKNRTQTDIKYVAKGLSLYDLKKVIVLSVITCNDDIIDAVFTREMMAGLLVEDVDDLVEHCYKLFKRAYEKLSLSKESVYNYLFMIIPQLLSRLIVKCSKKHYEQYFEVVEKIYEKRNYQRMNTNKIVSRILQNMPIRYIDEHMHIFWKYVFYIEDNDPFYPDCLSFIIPRQLGDTFFNKHDKFDQDIDSLFKAIDTTKNNNFAKHRLGYAAMLYEFNEEQKEKFTKLLYGKNKINQSIVVNYFPVVTYRNITNLGEFVSRNLDELVEVIKTNKNNISLENENAIHEISYIFDVCHIYLSHQDNKQKQLNQLDEQINTLINCLEEFCEYQSEEVQSLRIHGLLYDTAIETLEDAGRLVGSLSLKYQGIDKKILRNIRRILRKVKSPDSLLSFILGQQQNQEQKLFSKLIDTNEAVALDAIKAFVILMQYGMINENYLTELIKPLFGFIDIRTCNYIIALDQLLNYGVDIENIDKIDRALLQIARGSAISNSDGKYQTNMYDKMYIREVTCAFAYDLKKTYSSKSIISGIEEWRNIASKSNEFVSVRNAWNDRNYFDSKRYQKSNRESESNYKKG